MANHTSHDRLHTVSPEPSHSKHSGHAPHVPEEVSPITGHKHPYVSEAHEGKPWFEWCVAAGVLVSGLVSLFGHVAAGIFLLSLTAFVCATVRLALRHKSPWKTRSIIFDVIIGYGLALGLPLTYIAVQLIAH